MQRNPNQLKDQSYDLLVCGGGIYGAWTAYDAALRGLKVALVDKADWAGGTSSASSKLIHGGLRYLETFDFKLVKKALVERGMLLQAAPHRVWPLRFGIPVYHGSRIGSFRLKVGLALYDWFAAHLPAAQQHQQHSKADFIEHFPGLKPAGLSGGFSYFDAQTDDARFVLELVDGACAAGAACVNYCEVTDLLETHGKINGATLHDVIDDSTFKIKATLVVDTTGRWSSTLLKTQQNYRLSKGIHLVMPAILQDEALLLTAKSDGRVFFIIPWYGLTLLGTTDSDYDGDLENVPISQADIRYLLAEANRALKTQWTESDIVGKFAGLRVLQDRPGDTLSSMSRDWTLRRADNGLLSSIGGKLTSAREDAAVIVDTVCEHLDKQSACQTFGKPFPWISGIEFKDLLADSKIKAKSLGIDDDSVGWLVKRHGKRIGQIFQLCERDSRFVQRIRPGLPFILADLVYCAQDEMVVHLDDLLRRRLPLLILANLTANEITQVAGTVATLLGWDPARIEAEAKRCIQQ